MLAVVHMTSGGGGEVQGVAKCRVVSEFRCPLGNPLNIIIYGERRAEVAGLCAIKPLESCLSLPLCSSTPPLHNGSALVQIALQAAMRVSCCRI